MSNDNYQIYFDCGHSRLRVGAFNKFKSSKVFYIESKFLFNHTEIEIEIEKIITFLEKNTNEYIDDINLMIDSPKMLSIGISVSKKIDGLQLRHEDIQFLVQEAKQQILKHYDNKNIVHIIINNYKINDVDYDYLPLDIKCNFVSIDILFICLPSETVKYFKEFFFKFDISINQVSCSSYAKTMNYKDNFPLNRNVSFIDVGFNKTSITTYVDNKIISLDTIPIGGNNITKDISKILEIDIKKAENLKLNFEKNKNLFSSENFSLELLQNIIFARTEEILEMCTQAIKLNIITTDQHKMILMGDGARILDNLCIDKLSSVNDIDFLEETMEDICQSGVKLSMGLNKQEVVVVPKKHIKQGFFEKLFHLFK